MPKTFSKPHTLNKSKTWKQTTLTSKHLHRQSTGENVAPHNTLQSSSAKLVTKISDVNPGAKYKTSQGIKSYENYLVVLINLICCNDSGRLTDHHPYILHTTRPPHSSSTSPTNAASIASTVINDITRYYNFILVNHS